MYGVDPPLTMKRVRSQNSQKNPRNKVVVRVPATSANMGPGFDALGLGLDIWNEISVERAAKFKITTEGEGAGAIPETVDENGESNHMVIKALKRAFEYAGEPMPRVKVHCRNRIPVCSGFGSSSAAIVGGLVAGLALAGLELRAGYDPGHPQWLPEELLQLATEMEGHPDNVAPSIYGGIQLSVQLSPVDMGGGPRLNAQLALSRRVPIPEGLRLVAYVPSEATRFSFASADKTNEMRALLPPDVPREQAVFNIQRTALLIDCLHRGDLSLLRFATEDVLHQPARARLAEHERGERGCGRREQSTHVALAVLAGRQMHDKAVRGARGAGGRRAGAAHPSARAAGRRADGARGSADDAARGAPAHAARDDSA